MRHAILILALLGAATSGGFGYYWHTQLSADKDKVTMLRLLGNEEVQAGEVADYDRAVSANYLLMAAACLGLVGGLLAFDRRWISAVVALFAATIGPSVLLITAFEPSRGLSTGLTKVSVSTGPLFLAGLLALWAQIQAEKPAATKRSPWLGLVVGLVSLVYLGVATGMYYRFFNEKPGIIEGRNDPFPAPFPLDSRRAVAYHSSIGSCDGTTG